MTKARPVTWPELLDFQFRIVGRRQAVRNGVTGSAVGRRIRSGAWQRLHRGTYATFSGVPPREARLWAALLRAGSGAVLSHETAAEVHELIDKPAARIHITVPISHDPARRTPIRGVTIHRSRNVASEPLPPWQLPRTPIAETVLDLIESAKTTDDAFALLARAVGRDFVDAAMLRESLSARKRMRRRPWLLEALTDVADGVMSPIELRYVRDVERAHGLPSARRQTRRELDSGVRFLDNFYEAYKLCVEIDGRLHPSARAEMAGCRPRQRQPVPRRRANHTPRPPARDDRPLRAGRETGHAIQKARLGWQRAAAMRPRLRRQASAISAGPGKFTNLPTAAPSS